MRLFRLLPLFALLACGGEAPAEAGPAASIAAAPLEVRTTAVATRDVPRSLRVTGTLLAVDDADVAAEVPGAVERIVADRGDAVKAGAPILVIDATNASLQAREAAAAVAAAEAQVKLAEAECTRAERLAEAGGVSSADRDRALAQCEQGARQLDAARARKALADANLGRATLRAPFAGVVAERMVSPGEYVAPGRAVVKLVATDPLRLELSVPERAASGVRLGAPLRFEVTDPAGVEVEARVERISPALRDRTRDLVVEATVPNPDGRLRPNSFAVARLELGAAPALVVPPSAIRTSGDVARVYVVRDGKAEERIVELGEALSDAVEVRVGLAAGEVVVDPLPEGLADGAPLAAR